MFIEEEEQKPVTINNFNPLFTSSQKEQFPEEIPENSYFHGDAIPSFEDSAFTSVSPNITSTPAQNHFQQQAQELFNDNPGLPHAPVFEHVQNSTDQYNSVKNTTDDSDSDIEELEVTHVEDHHPNASAYSQEDFDEDESEEEESSSYDESEQEAHEDEDMLQYYDPPMGLPNSTHYDDRKDYMEGSEEEEDYGIQSDEQEQEQEQHQLYSHLDDQSESDIQSHDEDINEKSSSDIDKSQSEEGEYYEESDSHEEDIHDPQSGVYQNQAEIESDLNESNDFPENESEDEYSESKLEEHRQAIEVLHNEIFAEEQNNAQNSPEQFDDVITAGVNDQTLSLIRRNNMGGEHVEHVEHVDPEIQNLLSGFSSEHRPDPLDNELNTQNGLSGLSGLSEIALAEIAKLAVDRATDAIRDGSSKNGLNRSDSGLQSYEFMSEESKNHEGPSVESEDVSMSENVSASKPESQQENPFLGVGLNGTPIKTVQFGDVKIENIGTPDTSVTFTFGQFQRSPEHEQDQPSQLDSSRESVGFSFAPEDKSITEPEKNSFNVLDTINEDISTPSIKNIYGDIPIKQSSPRLSVPESTITNNSTTQSTKPETKQAMSNSSTQENTSISNNNTDIIQRPSSKSISFSVGSFATMDVPSWHQTPSVGYTFGESLAYQGPTEDDNQSQENGTHNFIFLSLSFNFC